ncbi:hypothetical protein [Thalassospira alkalitolerans]|uniref:hypothetical protein n=1 Tax=Thalassospira alkalitolerans TaxID=1293890 RepID=UPI003AA9C84F
MSELKITKGTFHVCDDIFVENEDGLTVLAGTCDQYNKAADLQPDIEELARMNWSFDIDKAEKDFVRWEPPLSQKYNLYPVMIIMAAVLITCGGMYGAQWLIIWLMGG